MGGTDGSLMPTIDIRDLAVRFATEGGAVHAVRGVSLAVEPGRVLGSSANRGRANPRRAAPRWPVARERDGEQIGLFEGRNLLSLPERELRHVRGRRIGWIFRTRCRR